MEIYNNLKLTSHSHQLRFNQELRRREGECAREAGEKKKNLLRLHNLITHTFIDTHTQTAKEKRKKKYFVLQNYQISIK